MQNQDPFVKQFDSSDEHPYGLAMPSSPSQASSSAISSSPLSSTTTNMISPCGNYMFPNSEFTAEQAQCWASPMMGYPYIYSTVHTMPSEEEYAQLQKLSQDYQPEVEGPLVGRLQASTALKTEYKAADEVYVQKTAVLPAKYAHYRTIRGDGNCGWRAIAFGYFEALQRIGDKDRIFQEISRLTSLNNLLQRVGYQDYLYEDFVEETVGLLKLIAAALPVQDDSVLLAKINDSEVSNSIVTHFRLLTSAWMKTRPELYVGFLEGVTIDQYCSYNIDAYQVEIEHVGITAVTDVLLKPAALALEVLYLDRSLGPEVNSHRFEVTDHEGTPLYPQSATIRLLYRPGHYDMLYAPGEVSESAASAAASNDSSTVLYHLQVPFVPLLPQDLDDNVPPWLAGIPGLSGEVDENGVPIPFCMNNAFTPPSYLPSPATSLTPSFASLSIPLSPSASDSPSSSFRPSKYEYEPASSQKLPFTTPTFRNSHFNPAHFRNAEFQPEMWSPECDAKLSKDDGRGR